VNGYVTGMFGWAGRVVLRDDLGTRLNAYRLYSKSLGNASTFGQEILRQRDLDIDICKQIPRILLDTTHNTNIFNNLWLPNTYAPI
jgi:hypothetical protein